MKVSIHFSLAPSKTSDLPIRMRISYEGLRLDLRTGFVCPVGKWDDQIMRVRPGAVNRYGEKASAINRALSKEEAVVMDILARYDVDGKVPEPSVLKADFEKAMGRKPSKRSAAVPASDTFLEVYKRCISVHGRDAGLSSGTVLGYMTVLAHLEDFSFAEKAPDDVTQRDLSDFLNEMRNLDIENQTISTYLSKIKSALRWARGEGLYHGTLPEDFRPKLKGLGQKDVHYLEWSEFEAIFNLASLKPSQASIRDAFCFCCCTGLRVSDCSKLRWADVNLTAEVPFISVVTKKTTKPIHIELNKWSRAILERQQARRGEGPGSFVFSPISVSSRNRQLPVIAKAAGISGQVRELSFVGNRCTEVMVDKAEAISTHWGRHTFVVRALHLGISPDVIMAWTGHSSYQSMKPYIAIADKTKAEKMVLFDK